MKKDFDPGKWLRPHLKDFSSYTCAGYARDDRSILLDANENPYCPVRFSSLNRYPDPLQRRLKERLSEIFSVPEEEILIGNGSNEIIDLLIRGFCRPGKDRVMMLPPTYGMYGAAAALNGVGVTEVPLDEQFQPQADKILEAAKGVKILFLCSPNNPTGNILDKKEVGHILDKFPGIIIADEAYIDFSNDPGWIDSINKYPNLAVLRTMSKSRGLAGIRMGMLFGNPAIVSILNSIRLPYNVSRQAIDTVLSALKREAFYRKSLAKVISRRKFLLSALEDCDKVRKVYPSESNFILAGFHDAGNVYRYLTSKEIRVRDFTSFPGCSGCLRITVGTKNENRTLLRALERYSKGDGK